MINENYRLKFLKLYEDFNVKGIPEELKYFSNLIRKDISNHILDKIYSIGSYNFHIKINYINSNNNIYKSNIDIFNIFENPDDIVEILINVEDTIFNIDKILSVIIHEIRHIYDIYSINNEYELYDFYKKRNLEQFKKTPYYKFSFLVYLSLEHEIIARNNMIYPLYRWYSNPNQIMDDYKKQYIYISLNQLKNFDSYQFVNNFDITELLKYTNLFIKDVAMETNFCSNKEQLLIYYKKWEEFFKLKSDEYYNFAISEINNVINDINKNIIFEKQEYEYSENNINETEKILKQFYNQIFKL